MTLPKSKRKFTQWIYVDEATNKEHTIQVYTVIEDDKIWFEAEARSPDKFTDTDENANVLHKRVMARCAEGRHLVWVDYYFVTVNTDGFKPDPFVATGGRRFFNISLLIEDVQVARLSDGETVWRGGRLSKFGLTVKPGWPPIGKTPAGGDSCTIEVTAENQAALLALYNKFFKVGKGMRAFANPKNLVRSLRLLSTEQENTHWKDFSREDNSCPETNHEPSSEQSEPSADAPAALQTASSSLAT
jgi:hypothetical protein